MVGSFLEVKYVQLVPVCVQQAELQPYYGMKTVLWTNWLKFRPKLAILVLPEAKFFLMER